MSSYFGNSLYRFAKRLCINEFEIKGFHERSNTSKEVERLDIRGLRPLSVMWQFLKSIFLVTSGSTFSFSAMQIA